MTTPPGTDEGRAARRTVAPQWFGIQLFATVVIVAAGAFMVERILDSTLLGMTLAAGAALLLACESTRRLESEVAQRKRLEREIVDASDRERGRIGQDLHDGLGQVLTGTALLSKALQKKLQTLALPEAADAGRIKDLVNATLDQTRSMARGLFPLGVEGDGLRRALEDLAADVDRVSNVSCRVEGELEASLEATKAAHVFRIAQEALSNAIRHGHARTVLIDLSSIDGGHVMRIEDDGVGIVKAGQSREGMGIRSMKHRAGIIGATIDIRRAKGRGTVVTCRFP